jgi:peptidoglycan-associated lipoprotein
MRFDRRRIATFVLAIVTPTLMAAADKDKRGCKCGPTVEDVAEPMDDDDDGAAAQSIEVALSVVRINPSSVNENQAFTALVLGSGFQMGAKVEIGGIRTNSASFVDENNISVSASGMAAGTYDVRVINPDGTASLLRSGLTVRSVAQDCGITTVRFDFDSFAMSDTGKAQLDAKLSCLSSGGGGIRVEGHADERGTTDYNLALAEKRAATVQKYLTGQSISPDRINVVSYGEERPVDPGHDEAAWSQNRRAEISILR